MPYPLDTTLVLFILNTASDSGLARAEMINKTVTLTGGAEPESINHETTQRVDEFARLLARCYFKQGRVTFGSRSHAGLL